MKEECDYLLESNIWREISFSNSLKSGLKEGARGVNQQECKCVECGIKINEKTQEILDKYIVKCQNKYDGTVEEIINGLISKTNAYLLDIGQVDKLLKIKGDC